MPDNTAIAPARVSLDDKYLVEDGRIYLSAIQALVRLPMMQRRRDRAAGLNTAGFISGYRGSPLGGLDQNLWTARKHLEAHDIRFEPGLNEELAATAVWGTQQLNFYPGARHDGIFSLYYAKGVGIDRANDAIKNANWAGTAPLGGVLCVAGDDHGAQSSMNTGQSEHLFIGAMMPVFNPANVQDYLDFGLMGWAMSRYAGSWVGFMAMGDTVESSASVFARPEQYCIQIPGDFEMPLGGLNIRWPDRIMEQEERIMRFRLPAARAFARANRIDRNLFESRKRRIGIVTTGKSSLDVMDALDVLGIDAARAEEMGLSVYKVGMVYPLETDGLRRFAEGLEELIVVEEKRSILEAQIKDELFNWRNDIRPMLIGKRDETGAMFVPEFGELSAYQLAALLARRISRIDNSSTVARWQQTNPFLPPALPGQSKLTRVPYFCSGCPHNTSTRLPDGSRAEAGTGCHYLATLMNRNTAIVSQMGGEGIAWIGQAPFTSEKHIFANMGDGTFQHSGILAIRFSVAAKVNVTYKILFNDAVAMTGGQPVEGVLTPAIVSQRVSAEGVKRIAVVSDEPEKYGRDTGFAPGTTVHHRDEMDTLQRQFREIEGVSAIIYDQTCAAEKRRRRKRGLMADPPRRTFINELVCEGCGDCSVQSNCISVEPLETEFGRKRKINQSSCNKDFSCLNGFCPSFVTVEGGTLRAVDKKNAEPAANLFADLPLPTQQPLTQPFNILITGVGGTGVITVGALLGMAAHLEGKGVSVLDQTGMAQKNGGVWSHLRIAAAPDKIGAPRLARQSCDLVLACDAVVAAGAASLGVIEPGHTRAIVNSHVIPPGAFVLDTNISLDSSRDIGLIAQMAGDENVEFIDGSSIATALMGDAIATNLFMLGFAFQRGQIPVGLAAIERAIELNGVSVSRNKRTFSWGRLAAHDLDLVLKASGTKNKAKPEQPESLETIVSRRAQFLTDYQNEAYAARYRALVEEVTIAERLRTGERAGLSEAVARYAFKLMAYKDEYEVARLYAGTDFLKTVREQFEGDFRLKFQLAPPLFAKRDPATDHLKKRQYGGWMLGAFGVLARLKGLRGTAFDVFGYTAERRMERRLVSNYENTVRAMLPRLTRANHALAIEIASIPEDIRGYGHIKDASVEKAEKRREILLGRFHDDHPAQEAAE